MVVGDLIVVTKSTTTGVGNGSLGIIKEVRRISKDDYIYFVHLIEDNATIPLWKDEFEVLSNGNRRFS